MSISENYKCGVASLPGIWVNGQAFLYRNSVQEEEAFLVVVKVSNNIVKTFPSPCDFSETTLRVISKRWKQNYLVVSTFSSPTIFSLICDQALICFSASGWIFFGEESSLRWTTISKVTVKKYLSKASSSMSRKKSLNNFLNSS